MDWSVPVGESVEQQDLLIETLSLLVQRQVQFDARLLEVEGQLK